MSDSRKIEGQDSTHCIKVAKPMRKRLTLPDEVCEKQETNKKMIRSLLRRIGIECTRVTYFENGKNEQHLIILNSAQMCQGSGEDCQSKQLHGHCIR